METFRQRQRQRERGLACVEPWLVKCYPQLSAGNIRWRAAMSFALWSSEKHLDPLSHLPTSLDFAVCLSCCVCALVHMCVCVSYYSRHASMRQCVIASWRVIYQYHFVFPNYTTPSHDHRCMGDFRLGASEINFNPNPKLDRILSWIFCYFFL